MGLRQRKEIPHDSLSPDDEQRPRAQREITEVPVRAYPIRAARLCQLVAMVMSPATPIKP